MLNIGIIGVGKMGMIHADLINEIGQLRLISIYDKNEECIKKFKEKYEVDSYTDIDEFLGIKMLDYVVIATTNDVHEELTIKALNKGKNVIVEKPMSVGYESTIRMIEAANENKRNLFVHHNRRWDRDFLLVRNVIDSGILGDILLIQSKVMLCDEGWPAWGIEGMTNPWRIKKKYGGGILFDWGVHLVDQLLLLVNKDIMGVYGILQKGVWSKEVEDYFFAVLKFDDNIVCQIEVSNNSMIEIPRWFIIGKKGTLEVKGKSVPIWDEVEIRYKKDDGSRENQFIKLVDVGEISRGFYRDLVLFLEGEKREFISMYDASKVVRVIDLIKESSSKNKVIYL